MGGRGWPVGRKHISYLFSQNNTLNTLGQKRDWEVVMMFPQTDFFGKRGKEEDFFFLLFKIFLNLAGRLGCKYQQKAKEGKVVG